MPHSMHTRIRCFGGSLLPNRRFKKDMPPPAWCWEPIPAPRVDTLDGSGRFPVDTPSLAGPLRELRRTSSWRPSLQGLIDERRKTVPDVAGVREHLDHEDEHQVCLRVDAVHAAVRAAPAERAGRVQPVGAEAVRRFEAEPEAEAG